MAYRFDKSLEVFKKAAEYIPSGIYGHQSPTLTVPGRYPYFAERGEGAYIYDVDGNKFIDWMCGYGPMVLGYKHPKVEAAAAKVRDNGLCFSIPTAVGVELAEFMVKLIDGAEWAVFGKNGSDLTTWAILSAREHTQRRKILMAKGAYHGIHAWCTPGHGGILKEDREHIVQYKFNDIGSIKKAIADNKNDVAGIIMTPYHHPAFGDSELPKDGFWQEVRAICDKEGIILIVDDVRAGFRLSIKGSHHYFGVTPDLAVFSKAMGNGYPISACTGREYLRPACSRVFLTGSFWNNADAMAASIATLSTMQKEKSVEKMMKIGEKLFKGMYEAAADNGLKITMSGPYTIPNMTFSNESDFRRMQLFSAECAERGVYLHPHHNWFVSAAHTEKDVEETVAVAREAFKVVKKTFGE